MQMMVLNFVNACCYSEKRAMNLEVVKFIVLVQLLLRLCCCKLYCENVKEFQHFEIKLWIASG